MRVAHPTVQTELTRSDYCSGSYRKSTFYERGCLFANEFAPTGKANALAPNLLQRLGDQEGQFQGLVGVQAWVAMGVVAV
ncbi:hypothetical protein Pres01_05510 [Metapseudomonas resinovorans]|nr:hypothetical protein Pres01_05510 [Pseudomonas resinovorans]